jgi:hypothetical protein
MRFSARALRMTVWKLSLEAFVGDYVGVVGGGREGVEAKDQRCVEGVLRFDGDGVVWIKVTLTGCIACSKLLQLLGR